PEHELHHLVVDRVERRHVEEPAADARLVRGHRDAIAVLVEPRDRLDRSGDGAPLRGRLDVVIAVEVDDAVAIEDDEFHEASFEMSATRFISNCSSKSRLRRLRRTWASSAITMTPSKNASTGPLSVAKLFRYSV